MSKYHEVEIWQNAEGRWSAGWYKVFPTPSSRWDDPDYDEEWDREFDHSGFFRVQEGYATADAAMKGCSPNPGSFSPIPYEPQFYEQIEHLNELVWEYKNPDKAFERQLARQEERAHRERIVSIENNIMPAFGTRVAFALWSSSSSYWYVKGKLDQDEDGTVFVTYQDPESKKEDRAVLYDKDGKPNPKMLVSDLRADYSLNGMGGSRSWRTVREQKTCGYPTKPSGVCQRPVMSGHCWQHR